MDTPRSARPLTYDEQRASEAAFQGLPPNPSWTEGAKCIYFQLKLATANTARASAETAGHSASLGSTPPIVQDAHVLAPDACQVWHLSLQAPSEQHLFVLDLHHPLKDVLQAIEAKWPHRGYRLDPITCGVFSLMNAPQDAFSQHPEQRIIQDNGASQSVSPSS